VEKRESNPRPEPGGTDYDIGAFEGARWEVYLPLVVRNYPYGVKGESR